MSGWDSTLSCLAALIPLASAVGNAVVTNNCAAPVYLWSVGGSVGPKQTIQPGKSYSEALHHDPASGGVSLKITRTDNGLYDGSPSSTTRTCPSICWPKGVSPGGSQVKNCGANGDIVLTLCAKSC
ncbi:putative BYS1 domain protein [Aspergillus novofumigatus IBT 16806]|uniref:BYS1 domain protein n=1 Tax=Aspergillus novofumigatus (strain IBT 16806) TaxID=1392255 RepID=A0A2I1CFW4_ASPN1|nr:uncharacterized protein P174DRAFT_457262 [Aspergillus novofumigatus IBT 16806]PKX96478.1 hypothetical protein P174DRAFT_457262 [Aspergillus novofumigatus IBT 16806]